MKKLLYLLSFPIFLFASTKYVSSVTQCAGSSVSYYTSIQTAITNSSSGDTVSICPGTYTENYLAITKDNLTLQGYSGNSADVIVKSTLSSGVTIKAANSTVKDLTINSSLYGITNTGGSGSHTFNNLTITSVYSGISLDTSAGDIFKNLAITSTASQGIYLGYNAYGAHTFSALTITSYGNGISVNRSSSLVISDANITSFAGQGIYSTSANTHTFSNLVVNSYGYGLSLNSASATVQLFSNIKVKSTYDAVHIYSGGNITFSDSNLTSTGGNGLEMEYGAYGDHTLSNLIINSYANGITTTHSSALKLNDIHITSSAGMGIYTAGGSIHTFSGVNLKSYSYGISINASTIVSLSEMNVTSTADTGIYAADGITYLEDFNITAKNYGIFAYLDQNTHMQRGYISTTSYDAIYLGFGSYYSVVLNDLVINSGAMGVHLLVSSAVTMSRLCITSKTYGVYAEGGTRNVSLKNSKISTNGYYGAYIFSNTAYPATITNNCFLASPFAYRNSSVHSFNGNYWNGTAPSGYDSSPLSSCPVTSCYTPSTLPSVDYRFDECTWAGVNGEVIDSSTNSYDATAKSDTGSSVATLSEQIINNSATFLPAFKQYVQLPTLSSGNPNLNDGFTITTWAKFSGDPSESAWERIFDIGNGTDNNNVFLGRYETTSNLVLGIHPGYHYLIAEGAISDTAWHFWAVSCDGVGGCALYKDGTLLVSTSTMELPADIGRTVNYIGKSNWSSDAYLEGGVDEFKIFDSVLSTSKIATIFANESARNNYDATSRVSIDCTQPIIESPITFDTWDTFRSINDRNISTKIVNKTFNLTIASLNESGNDLQDFNGTVCIDLINTSDTTHLARQCRTWNNQQSDSTYTFTIAKAIADAKVKLSWKKNDFSGSFTDGSEDNTSIASDHFAIRPATFAISAPNAIAGVDFNLIVTAPDFIGNTSLDYNESAGNSFTVSVTEHNSSCGLGTFNPAIGNFSFTNGSKLLTTRYSEVGTLDVNISDLSLACNSRFASIDCDDANVSDGTSYSGDLIPIGFKHAQIVIKPHHFDISGILGNFNNTFTYVSSDLNMSAPLFLTLTAKNGENNTTRNYHKNCYANPTTLTLPHSSVPTPLTQILSYEHSTGLTNTTPKNSDLSLTFDNTIFNSGIADLRLYFNFDRSISKPLNPFDFTFLTPILTDTIDGSSSATGTAEINGTARFAYGRVRAYDISTNQTYAYNPVEFEIYSMVSTGLVAGMPQNVLHWYRNTAHNNGAEGNVIQGGFGLGSVSSSIDVSALPENGIQNLNVTSSSNQTVHLDIDQWLWYSPQQNPYNFGSTCAYHPCFNYSHATTVAVIGVNSGVFKGSDFTMIPAKSITKKGVKLFR